MHKVPPSSTAASEENCRDFRVWLYSCKLCLLCEVRLDSSITSIVNVYTFKKTTAHVKNHFLVTHSLKNEQRAFLNAYDISQVQRLFKLTSRFIYKYCAKRTGAQMIVLWRAPGQNAWSQYCERHRRERTKSGGILSGFKPKNRIFVTKSRELQPQE